MSQIELKPDGSRVYTTIEGETVDGVAFKVFGSHDRTTEAFYEANHGLCRLGLVLPLGTKITVPDQPPPQPKETVQLWD